MRTFHLIKQKQKPQHLLLPFWLFRVSTMSFKMNRFISNCYMPAWFMCFSFSTFHRCRITQICALVHLHRFLPPCPAESPCLRFSCSSCLHTLLTHPSTAHVQPPELNWSECAFGASELALLQDFATPVLPSDVKCFVEEADLNTSVKAESSFISFVKRCMIIIPILPNCVGFDSFSYYLLST